MSGFNNYHDKGKTFDSFNGTELKCYLKIATKYDDFGQMKKFELVELGNISAFSGAEQFALTPVPVIGEPRPAGIGTGSSMVAGSMAFETFNEGFVNEVKRVLSKAGIKNHIIYFDKDDEDGTPNFGTEDITEINEFPLVDLVMIGVKENNKNKKVQMEVQGIRFNKGASGIGINQLGVREQYSYIAIKMTDFQPVSGAEEEIINSYNEDDSIFF